MGIINLTGRSSGGIGSKVKIANKVKLVNYPQKWKKKANVKIPWRFQIEDDGFVFPKSDQVEKYVTYQPLHTSWTKQILEFENAIIFAYLLQRTLLVPPLLSHKLGNYNLSSEYPISRIIDFRTLSRTVPLKQVSMQQLNNIGNMSVYRVCHDYRLGFWLDYIPAVEDIQMWRQLRAQQFSVVPFNIEASEVDLMCPGTFQYRDRWGPPMKIKPQYRGILTELYDRNEDIIYFEGDTLNTKDLRFFDKHRTKKMQEILIFHIRFSHELNRNILKLMKLLGRSYNAILSGPIDNDTDITGYLVNEAEKRMFYSTSKVIVVVCEKKDEQKFQILSREGFTIIFANDIVSQDNELNIEPDFTADKRKLYSILLCAYAVNFIGLPSSPHLFFVDHLRMQNVTIKDGLVTDKISVRWAKHTTRPKPDEGIINKALFNSTKEMKTTTINKKGTADNHKLKASNLKKGSGKAKIPSKRDRLDIMACMFCNYIRRITGQHGCPSMKSVCP